MLTREEVTRLAMEGKERWVDLAEDLRHRRNPVYAAMLGYDTARPRGRGRWTGANVVVAR